MSFTLKSHINVRLLTTSYQSVFNCVLPDQFKLNYEISQLFSLMHIMYNSKKYICDYYDCLMFIFYNNLYPRVLSAMLFTLANKASHNCTIIHYHWIILSSMKHYIKFVSMCLNQLQARTNLPSHCYTLHYYYATVSSGAYYISIKINNVMSDALANESCYDCCGEIERFRYYITQLSQSFLLTLIYISMVIGARVYIYSTHTLRCLTDISDRRGV